MVKYIGTNNSNYNQKRNFIQLSHKFYRFVEIKDIFKYLTNFLFLLTKQIYKPLQFLFYPVKKENANLYHFFNAISLINTPWVVTFETSVPRLGNSPKWLYNYSVRRLSHGSCKRLIAMSECTAQIQTAYLLKNYPKISDQILHKMLVLQPSQEVLVRDISVKKLSNKVVFSLIGADFFRKGGKEVLQVFDELISQKLSIHLNIISSLEYGDYASRATVDDYNQALAHIAKHKSNITHYSRLPNDRVLELLKQSHVGLLPTYADTYGYSVLEAQAAGCPVITTDVRALPEINNNECGWIIKVPKDKMGNAVLATAEDRRIVSTIIRDSLFKIITSICNNQNIVLQKGKLALEKIKKEHDPDVAAEKLKAIYDEALC